MASIQRFLQRSLKGALQAFGRYPATLLSAFLLAASASYRIAWPPETEATAYFLDSLQWSLFLVAFLALPLSSWGMRHGRWSTFFWLSNVLAAASGVAVFLFLLARISQTLPPLLEARMIVAAAVSLIAFTLLLGDRQELSGFSSSLFLILKSWVIAVIYATVLLLGLFFITFAIESLLYENLSSQTYQHIAVWSYFAALPIFLGGIPSLDRQPRPEAFRQAAMVPRFMQILFLYVFMLLMTLLSFVLLLWIIQILLTGSFPPFTQLSVIFSIYNLTGFALILLASPIEKPIRRWFERAFPFAALVFSAFFTHALRLRLQEQGLKTAEYVAGLIILFSFAGAVFYILRLKRRGEAIAFLTMALLLFSVMPVVSHLDLPARAQANRLQNILQKHDLLVEGTIRAEDQMLDRGDRETVTDAAFFLLDLPPDRQPAWLTDSLATPEQFEDVFGFAPAFPDAPEPHDPLDSVFLHLPAGQLRVEGDPSVYVPRLAQGQPETEWNMVTAQGEYQVHLFSDPQPGLQVWQNETLLLEEDFRDRFISLFQQHRDAMGSGRQLGSFDDLVLSLESESLQVTLLFEFVEITDLEDSGYQFSFSIHSFYLVDADE